MSDLITIGAACRLIGGDEKPIQPPPIIEASLQAVIPLRFTLARM
jgi:hypothetical protein